MPLMTPPIPGAIYNAQIVRDDCEVFEADVDAMETAGWVLTQSAEELTESQEQDDG